LFKNFFAYALQDTQRLAVIYTFARDQTDAVLAAVDAAIEGD
jgi:hypothetical protein